ncbi:MAG: PGF-pre-PGF domain-containing protein, partial [Haloarculaceae archaeon]
LELTADGSVVAERTVAVGPSSERSVTLQTRFGDLGEYALSVNGMGIGTVVVTEDTSEAAPPGTGTPGEQPTDVADGEARSAAPVRVDLAASASNGTASAELDDSLRSETVSLRELSVSAAERDDEDGDGSDGGNGNVGFVVTRPSDSVPATARELDTGTAVQYFTLSPTNDSRSEVETVDLQFEVNASALPSGSAPEDVVLYHYTDGAWVALPTTYDPSADTYTATVDGFSPFAVGVSSTNAAEDGTSARSPRGTEASGMSPTTQESRDPATGTATPAGSSDPTVPWLFWSSLGGFALLFVLFLARNRVPFGGDSSEDRDSEREDPAAVGDRTPGGGTDDD